MSAIATRYEVVVGLEVHAQILTESKMFCGCSTDYLIAPPNANTCPVCLGLPGSLPVINRKAVEATIRTALALNCEIPEIRPQELFLSRPAQGLPDLAIRSAV